MKILSVMLNNFGSYKDFFTKVTGKGLVLVAGPTGHGKSTFFDMVPWVLFGTTAKGLGVDEVKTWKTNEPTLGSVTVSINNNVYTIVRTRGTKKNDLYYMNYGNPQELRGKDTLDTQKLINQALGIDANLYLSGCYYHEFSPTSTFFNTTAKNRRLITEQIADLSLSKKLDLSLSQRRKELKDKREKEIVSLKLNQNSLEHYEVLLTSENEKKLLWRQKTLANIIKYRELSENFETNKKAAYEKELREFETDIFSLELQLKDCEILPDSVFDVKFAELEKKEQELPEEVCSECGARKNSEQRLNLTKQRSILEREKLKNDQVKINVTRLHQSIEARKKRHLQDVMKIENTTNQYHQQILELQNTKNPHSVKQTLKNIDNLKIKIHDLQSSVDEMSVEISDLDLLEQVNETFRTSCISNSIKALEFTTNGLLRDYFDAVLTVKFEADQKDRLDVSIRKDGNECSFQQLSKGQKQLLKLCFGVAVMESVSNQSGVKFEHLWFDEALDGLSESLKLDAMKMFTQLASHRESLFLIDHSEQLKTMATTIYDVYMEHGASKIEEL